MDSASNPVQFAEQNVFSMLFESWRVLLALGILAGLVNLLAKPKNREALGIEIPKQLIAHPVAFGLGVIALLLVALSLTSLPTLPLLVLAELFVLVAWTNYQKTKMKDVEEETVSSEIQPRAHAATRSSILRLELGSSLLALASPEMSQNLVEQLASLRAVVLDTLGLKLPSICIKDDLKLPTNTYRIYLRNGLVGEGTVYKDRYMVIASEETETTLDGIQEQDPVFGLPVLWITEKVRDDVGKLFVQTMDPVAVVITHISNIVDKHASELLTREEVSEMVTDLREIAPRLVERVIGKVVSFSRFHRILQSLLEEKVSVKDLSTIVETAADSASFSLEDSVEKIRIVLRRQICANVARTEVGGQQVIRCIELPFEVEVAISNQCISKQEITDAVHDAAIPLISEGLPIVVVSSAETRRQIREQVTGVADEVFVLSRSEIVSEVELQVVGMIEPKEFKLNGTRGAILNDDKQRVVDYARSLLDQGTVPSTITQIEHQIELGFAEIKTLVGEVLVQDLPRSAPMNENAQRLLVHSGIEPALASEIVQSIDINSTTSSDEAKQQMVQELIRRLPRALPPPARDSHEPIVIALVGPTGVGKTTTIAKLATKFKLQQGRSVALITADTYRVAAIDQLQQYADLFDARLAIAGTTMQMKDAMELCSPADIILIDTAGRSAADGDRIQETASILRVAQPDEIHLVLSAATSRSASLRAVEGFGITGYDRIIISKLDEAPTLGETVSTLCSLSTPLSWFTNGQDISAHLSQARPSKLISAIWEEQHPITC